MATKPHNKTEHPHSETPVNRVWMEFFAETRRLAELARTREGVAQRDEPPVPQAN